MDVQADALRLKPSASPVHFSSHFSSASCAQPPLLRTVLAEIVAPWPWTDLSHEC